MIVQFTKFNSGKTASSQKSYCNNCSTAALPTTSCSPYPLWGALFDVGVFLAVVGAVMLSLESFSRLARRAEYQESEYAMDIDPSRDELAEPEEGV